MIPDPSGIFIDKNKHHASEGGEALLLWHIQTDRRAADLSREKNLNIVSIT
jgi:hypothetical protein